MNIIITGASRGIGYQLVKTFAQTGNHTIIAISRNGKALKRLAAECFEINRNARVVAVEHSITDRTPLPWVQFLGDNKVDICINNAGYLVNKPFGLLSTDEMNEMMEVNFMGAARLIQELLPMANTPCHIVNISSMGGFQGSAKFVGLSVYSASKAALACLTECLAEELREQSISCNCLALGAVGTEMFASAFPGHSAPTTVEEAADFIVRFAIEGHRFFNGKVLPVSISTP